MSMQKCVLTAFAILSLGTCAILGHAQADRFTVTDSIQMVHFNDPDGRSNRPAWNISPDGLTALLVTTKGIVSSNMMESTLWTLDLRATAKYVDENARTPPSPKEILTMRGQLHAFQGDSYGSLITNCMWSLDSRAIYVLLEQKAGRRELDKVDLITGHTERLSPEDYSVGKYEIDRRGVLYSAVQFQKSTELLRASTSDVVDSVEGASIFGLLWPSIKPNKFLFRSDNNGTRPIAPAPNANAANTFSISPDGRKVITLVPVKETPITWKAYLPGYPTTPLYRSGSSLFPVLEYEVVDLHTNARRPLLGSPSGRTVGYDDVSQVVWSPGLHQALVTNIFLPFDHQTPKEQEARRRLCAAAYIDVGNGSATCIVFSRASRANESLDSWAISDIEFAGTDHGVVINLSWRGRHKTECYSSTGGVWSESSRSVCDASVETLDKASRSPVRLELIQSLDEPPSLWAENVKNSRQVHIWSPNPQIAGKLSGKTAVYHWLDEDNREWSGELILPQGPEPAVRLPLVIQTHGFRPNEYLVDGAWTTAMAARPLAAAGFAVLQIEDNHEQTETLEEAKIHVNGYKAAVDQLAQSGVIDAKRVGIIGFSRTCWFVEEALLEFPDRFAAAVIADGVDQSYLQYLLSRPENPAMESERYNGGEPIGKELESWIKAAPGFRLSELKTPLRVQAIGPVSLLNEWEIYALLKVQDKPTDLLYLPQGQHVLQNPAERMASEQGDVDWFRYWLKGEEDQDPAKRPQYERWGKLRKRESRWTRETIKTKDRLRQ